MLPEVVDFFVITLSRALFLRFSLYLFDLIHRVDLLLEVPFLLLQLSLHLLNIGEVFGPHLIKLILHIAVLIVIEILGFNKLPLELLNFISL